MNCKRRTSASTFLTVVLVIISLLALDHPIAHARHVKDSSTTSTGDSSFMKEGLEGIRKLNLGKIKNTENVQVTKATRGKDAQHSFGWNLGHGGSLSAKFAKVVVVDHHGPKPHPSKHN